MNTSKSFLSTVTVLAVMVAIVGNCLAQIVVSGPLLRQGRTSLVIGDFLYYSYTDETRTRADAQAYCEAQGGELAKVLNKKLYDQLRLGTTTPGAYWIDGIDRVDEGRFQLTQACPSRSYEYLDFSQISRQNLALPQVSCLSLVKGKTAATSKIEVANCTEQRFVLCRFDMNDCPDVSSSTWTMIPA